MNKKNVGKWLKAIEGIGEPESYSDPACAWNAIAIIADDGEMVHSSSLISDWAAEHEDIALTALDPQDEYEDKLAASLSSGQRILTALVEILERLIEKHAPKADGQPKGEPPPAIRLGATPSGPHQPGLRLYHGTRLASDEVPELRLHATNGDYENVAVEGMEHIDSLGKTPAIWMADDRGMAAEYAEDDRGRRGARVVYEFTLDARCMVREVNTQQRQRDDVIRNALQAGCHALQLERGCGTEYMVLTPDCLQLVAVDCEVCGDRQSSTGHLKCSCS